MRCFDSVRNNGEKHRLCHSLATPDENEQRRQPDQTDRNAAIEPTDQDYPDKTEEHPGGEEQKNQLPAILPCNRAVVDG